MTSANDQCDEQWGQIEEFLAGISELARSSAALSDFADETLQRTVELLEAGRGTLWLVDAHQGFRAVSESTNDQFEMPVVGSSDTSAIAFLQSIVRSGEVDVQPVASQPGLALKPGDRNHGYVRIGAPFRGDRDVRGVIEVVQPSSINEASLEGNKRLLAMVSDLTGDFLRREQLNELRESIDQWRQFESLSQRAHASLDLRATAYHLANDGRLFLQCDRVSIVVPSGNRFRTIAISGVDSLDRRSEMIGAMEELSAAVAPSQQWLRFRGDTDQLPPQLATPLVEFADLSHSQCIDVVPLLAPSTTSVDEPDHLVGVMVVERFDATDDPSNEDRIVRTANLASSALRNAIDYETLPLLSLARWARRAIRLGGLKPRNWAIGGFVVLASILALGAIPATHYVEAEGEAQPMNRRNVYAPYDGEVVNVLSMHDQTVSQEQVLVTLRSRDFERELERLQGEYQTTEKKLLAVASARIQGGGDESGNRFPSQLAAEEQELKQQLESQRAQISLVRKQIDDLEVRSPIAGRVLTWDPRELLTDRPVQRGQLLISVADLTGPWVLELNVPDRRVGHVILAQQRSAEPLEVTFALARGSAQSFQGTLQTIAARTEVIGDDQAATRVLVSVPQQAVENLRPGATIHAKLNCGRRTLGYVWLHDAYDRVRTWLLF